MVLPYCDEFFADFKIADSKKHIQYIGQTNELILSNLQKLVERKPNRVTIRIPLIPSVNDTQEDIEKFAKVISPMANKLSGVEILRYNALAKSKYELCGKNYTDFGEAQSDEELLEFCNQLRKKTSNHIRVFTTI